MIDLGPHLPFILAAYFGVLIVTSALIAATWRNWVQTKKRLEAIEKATGQHRDGDL